MDLRDKLQALDVERIELASISRHRGSEHQDTDAGFALSRFLNYAGSLCDSPPRSLSGSPVIAPSDAVVNTGRGSLDSSFDKAIEEISPSSKSSNKHKIDFIPRRNFVRLEVAPLLAQIRGDGVSSETGSDDGDINS